MTNALRFSFLLVWFAAAPTTPASAQCIETIGNYQVPFRIFANGAWAENKVFIPFPQWGLGTYHHSPFNGMNVGCVSGKTNCKGAQYPWVEITVDHQFSVPKEVNGVIVNVTIAHVEAFFDNMYLPNGFVKIGPMDFTQNCHGYTFGLGCHVSGQAYGIGMYLNIGENGCLVETNPLTAQYALHDLEHSAKVVGQVCTGVYMCMEFGFETIWQRTEKNGVGPTYKKFGCISPVLWSEPFAGYWTLVKDRPQGGGT